MSDVVHVELRSVVFDCEDAVTLATFYQNLLGGELSTSDPDWCEVRCASKGFKLAFQLTQKYRAPEWPDGLPQQMHLDLSAYIVHLDPAGHPFCLCQEGLKV